MIEKNKIAFVFGRPALNTAKLQYMPFALSTLTKLAEDSNNEINVYITQSHTKDYEVLLPENVHFIFLDKPYLWNKGAGKGLYLLLNVYFYFITQFKKYNTVFGIGQTGVVLGGKLAKRKRISFICLNDEFPDTSYLKVWRENEKKYTTQATTIILPDESRVDVLKRQIKFSSKAKFGVLPNIPLQSDINNLPPIDWRQKLDLNENTKLIVYAGGIDKENNIDFLLTVFPFTPTNFFLIMVGRNKYKNNNYLTFDRVLWIEKPLTDDELHSLVSQATCTVGYYADFMDLEYVGKSSGKIMRSLLIGTPVISTKFQSLQFIEDDGMGILIKKPFELIAAIQNIDSYRNMYTENIKKHIHKYTFENYWKDLQTILSGKI